MGNSIGYSARQYRVTAVFSDHEKSFDVGRGSTLEQITDRLSELARQNHAWPLGVSIVFDAPASSAHPAEMMRQHPHLASVSTGNLHVPADAVRISG